MHPLVMTSNTPVPRFPLGAETLIWDVTTEEPLIWIDGILPLPVGAVIRVTDVGGRHGTWDAVVQAVGTLPVGLLPNRDEQPGVCVRLDVILVQPGGD